MVKTRVKRNKGNITLPKNIVGHRKVKAGFPKGEVSSDVLERAIYNNFGTQNTPERPFMSNAFRDNLNGYKQAMRDSVSNIILGNITVGNVMAKLGIKMQGDIQSEITNLRSPANADSTIKQKGSSNPLIDTDEMRQDVTYQTYD